MFTHRYYYDCSDVNFVAPVTRRAASFRIFSKVSKGAKIRNR